MPVDVREVGGRLRFSVRVQARASRNAVVGEHAGALRVRVAAAPVDGAANRELVSFLGEVLGVPRAEVRVAAGEHARSKVVEVPASARRRLDALLAT